MYIHRLHIENLRCFREAQLEFVRPLMPDAESNSPPPRIPNVNLILADNGGGKTTALRAVALSVLGPILTSSGLSLYWMVRRAEPSSSIFANLTVHIGQHEQDTLSYWDWNESKPAKISLGSDNGEHYDFSLAVSITRRGDVENFDGTNLNDIVLDGLFDDDSPAYFVLGYGATRRTESNDNLPRQRRINRYQRVAGLFEDHVALMPLAAWLPRVEDDFPQRFEEIRDLINALLPNGTQLFSTKEHQTPESRSTKSTFDRYFFSFGESFVPFPALSDGYRAYIGWIGDMLYHLHSACPLTMQLTECRGVVMVDEVDLHLHPSWQRTVVDNLSQTFPRLQFILTSHSPIVAGTLEPANIWVMETNEDGSVSPKRYQERIFGLSADQILTSSYFGLPTTRAPQAEKEIRALTRRAANGDPDASLEALRRLNGDIDGEDLSEGEADGQ